MWHSWQSGWLRHQRSAVWIPLSAKFVLNIVLRQLCWKDENKEKEGGNGQFFKKYMFFMTGNFSQTDFISRYMFPLSNEPFKKLFSKRNKIYKKIENVFPVDWNVVFYFEQATTTTTKCNNLTKNILIWYLFFSQSSKTITQMRARQRLPDSLNFQKFGEIKSCEIFSTRYMMLNHVCIKQMFWNGPSQSVRREYHRFKVHSVYLLSVAITGA